MAKAIVHDIFILHTIFQQLNKGTYKEGNRHESCMVTVVNTYLKAMYANTKYTR